MAFLSWTQIQHSANTAKELSAILSSQVIHISVNDWHSQLPSICKRFLWFPSAELELSALKAAVAAAVSQLPWSFPLMVPHPQTRQPSLAVMLWHDMAYQRDRGHKAATASKHSVTPAQRSRLTGKPSQPPHFYVIQFMEIFKDGWFTLRTRITAPEIRSLLKF